MPRGLTVCWTHITPPPLCHELSYSTVQADANVEVSVLEHGEHVIAASGELHMERCLKDLMERFAPGSWAPLCHRPVGCISLCHEPVREEAVIFTCATCLRVTCSPVGMYSRCLRAVPYRQQSHVHYITQVSGSASTRPSCPCERPWCLPPVFLPQYTLVARLRGYCSEWLACWPCTSLDE